MRNHEGMKEKLLGIPLPQNHSVQLSEGIMEFLERETLPAKSDPEKASGGAIINGGELNEDQMVQARQLFTAYDVPQPQNVVFAKMLPSVHDEARSVNSAKARGFVYIALTYDAETVFYGGILHETKAYAPHMHKRIMPISNNGRKGLKQPRADQETYATKSFTPRLRKFGEKCLNLVGVTREQDKITPTEFEMLDALAAIG